MGLAFDFIAQLPPKAPGFFGPEQNPEAAAFTLINRAPLVIYAGKPAQAVEEIVAERRLEPHEVFAFRGPITRVPQG